MSNIGKISLGIVCAIGGAALILLFWAWGLNIIHYFTTDMREATPFWFFAIITIGFIIAAIVAASVGRGVGKWILGAAIGFVLLLVFTIPADYNRLNGYFNASVQVKKDSMASSYEERSPKEVATLTSAANMMNHNGNIRETKSLAEEGTHGEWNSLINTRGPFNGYEAVQNSSYPLFGTPDPQTDIKFCDFNKAHTLRDSGSMPHNNLSRAIFGMIPLNVAYDAQDIYSYCAADDEPVVVIPLKEINGFFYPLWSYYGVATYNGKTGDLKVITDTDEINKIPGPVYPITLAETQRKSLVTLGGDFWSYFFGTSGYITATQQNSEVNLKNENGNTYFVTSLTPRGSSTSVVAVAEVSSGEVSGEPYNPLILNVFPKSSERSANHTLEAQIFSDYAYMPDFNNSKVEVFEFTAGKNGGWVTSVGRAQSVMYRAYITSDNEITLKNKNGDVIAKGNTSPTGETDVPDSGVTWEPGTDMSELTVEQLNQIGEAVMDELAKRANASKPADG